MEKLFEAEVLSVNADGENFEFAVAPETGELMQPIYYVAHPDETFSVADPQPVLSPRTVVRISTDQANELVRKISHFVVTK